MNFSFTPEQDALRAEARRFLAERVDVRAQIALPGAHDTRLWSEMSALGWLDDMPLVDECILVEETGRALLPGPFLAHRLGDDAAAARPTAAAEDTQPSGADLTRAPLRARPGARATILLSAESCGVAARALDMAVAYASDRVQFGRPIGSFQAIKHKAADVLRAVQAARLATYAAATDPGDAFAVATAKALANDAVLRATKENIQIHGGIGVTWEHDAHLLYRRALANSVAFRTTAESLDAVAGEIFAAP
jgi:alkylation response protein AidB-like acyl-CoA dehydrogenase